MESHVVPGAIVVGVDGSEHADRAVAWAARQAVREQRTLLVLHSRYQTALRDTAWLDAEGIDHVELRNALGAAARSVLQRGVICAGLAAPGAEIDSVLVDVDPRTALSDASEVADLVVLGSRGRGPTGSLLLGSVSRSVARHAACPVVVCRPGPAPGDHSGIVVGVDGSPESRPVLEFAFRQAALRGLPLTVMSSFWDTLPPTTYDDRGPIAGGAEQQRAQLAEEVAGLQEKFVDVAASVQLHRGLVDECLLGRPPAADLLVVGRREGHGVTRFLHASGAIAVLERAHVTVAVVPEGHRAATDHPA